MNDNFASELKRCFFFNMFNVMILLRPLMIMCVTLLKFKPKKTLLGFCLVESKHMTCDSRKQTYVHVHYYT